MSIYCNFVENFEPKARSLIETHPPDDGTDDLASNLLVSAPKVYGGFVKASEEIWTVRQGLNGEEELYARAKSVYWTRNNRIVKSFNFTDQVVKVFWSEFAEQDHVVIALTSGLSIFNKMGQHFQIPLPFPYHDMHVSRLGVLIERSFDSLEESSSLPVLFSLTHPTREIAPILFEHPSRRSLTYTVPSYMSMVACHDKLPLCLMFNSQDCRHSIWLLRKATEDEIDGFQKETTNTYNQSSCSLILGNLAASRLGVGASQMTPDHTRSFKNMTPNRNRIINYLRDNIEDPILPELTCEQLWNEDDRTKSSKGNKFFSTQDFVGNQYFVIVISSSTQLKMTSFEVSKQNSSDIIAGKEMHIIQAIDAMPIHKMNMMIVLEVNKSLALYSGLGRVTTVNIQQLSSPMMPISTPGPNRNHHPELTPVQMSSARKRSSLGDCTSMGSDSSMQQMLTLSPVPHVNKHDTIRRIEHAVGNTVFVRNAASKQACFQIPHISQTQLVERLIEAMKRLVSKEQGLTITSQWYQMRRAIYQPELMPAKDEIELFKDWLLIYIGIESDVFDLETCDISIMAKTAYPSPTKKTRKTKDVPDGLRLTTDMYSLFIAIHLVVEDLLLMKLCYISASALVELQLVLAGLLKLPSYQDYYWLKFPHLQKRYGPLKERLEKLTWKPESTIEPSFFRANPPSIIEFLERLISESRSCDSSNTLEPYPNLIGITSESSAVISLFCAMFNVDKSIALVPVSASTTSFPNTNVLSKKPHRSKLADQAVVTCMVELGKDKNYLSRLPPGYNLYLWDAILNCRESPPTNWCEACFELIGRMDLVSLVGGFDQIKSSSSGDKSGTQAEDEALRLLFPDDIRVLEAQRMLTSDQPVEFSITSRQGATEEESRDETHRHLYLLNVRTMGMPVGRGAISLRTYPPVIGESFEVPRLELSGRVLSEDRPIEYTHDISVYPWPFFHNGVAAGLTISAASANNIIDSTWINYNRPRSNIAHGVDIRDRDLTTVNINNEHAGFLFALGLNGHLEKLSLMALHDYLCQNNDLTKLAILLGMSAAKRGSRDNNIIKVLSIHVDALLPPNSTELDVPASVHAASIMGVGLLYLGSADSHISKVLLEEIGRLPGPETNSHVDRESYSLSAGLAFGLVNLCKGGLTTISSSDQLRLYMLGGKRKPLTLAQKERYFKQDCHRGEEEYINTHITGPGGTLGLGLMYHRSGNQSVANWMRAPDTQTLLEYVRPDFLILRMLSYGLIMWDEVEPSEDWINGHIPKIVSTHAFQRNLSPITTTNRLVDSSATVTNPATDYELISQAYCNIVAGCCMAIALRYAGTANRNAYKTIYKHTKMLIALSNKPALAEQAGRPCIEACLNVLVTSLAVVMAGTGDLGVMRVCRYLRSRLTQSCVFYGSYMAIHMSLGILFLGSCRYSFSTAPDAIGALVCALYPIYPNHSSDNRYHLQALRHLYVLAAEPRLLIPRDITTNKPVYVNITIRQRLGQAGDTDELKLRAPCLVPEVDNIVNVYVDDEKYWRIEINDREALVRCLLKDNGYLSVKRKAHSSNNQLVQDIETYILHGMAKGCMKSRKEKALGECVREDRVEQYSAINELLTKLPNVDAKFRCLMLEQLRLACSLADKQITNKLNMLKPILGEINDRLSCDEVHMSWFRYLSRENDWTSAEVRVAEYIVLNDLRCPAPLAGDADSLIGCLRELDLHTKQTVVSSSSSSTSDCQK